MEVVELPKILIVEDLKFDSSIIKEIITELNYTISGCFEKAEDSWDYLNSSLKKELPDLLIIDLVLKGKMTGQQLAKKIKEKYNLPIIFLTAKTEEFNFAQSDLHKYCDIYLTKPIKKSELKNNIEIIFNRDKIFNYCSGDINPKILAGFDNMICCFSDPYTYSVVNKKYASFIGKQAAQLKGEKVFDIFPLKIAETIVRENIRIMQNKQPVKKEKWILNYRGENKLLAIKKQPIFTSDGKVKSIICEMEDITEKNILEKELRRNRDNLQKIIETIPDLIFLINEYGKIIDFWTVDENNLLFSKSECIQKNIKDILTPDLAADYFKKAEQVLKGQEPVTFEYSLQNKQNKQETLYYEAKMTSLEDDTSAKKLLISVRDISASKKIRLELEQLYHEYEVILSNIDNSIFLLNVENETFRYQRLNKFHQKYIKIKAVDIEGKTPVEAFGEELGNKFAEKYSKCLRLKESISYEEEVVFSQQKRIFLTKLTPVFNQTGEIEKIVGSSLDITEEKARDAEIKYLSFHDEMTGLYNRRYFEKKLKEVEVDFKLHPAAIMIADLDGLKFVNDNYGHKCGDNYIKMAAKLIKSVTESNEIVARIGGDEFAIILTNTTETKAQNLLAKIKAANANVQKAKNLKYKFSISIGYAVQKKKDNTAISLETVFTRADRKMYCDKEKNKSNLAADNSASRA